MATKLRFYDVVAKRKFQSANYKFKNITKHGRTTRFAVTKGPSGHMAWRIVPRNMK